MTEDFNAIVEQIAEKGLVAEAESDNEAFSRIYNAWSYKLDNQAYSQWYENCVAFLTSKNTRSESHGYLINIRKDAVSILLHAFFINEGALFPCTGVKDDEAACRRFDWLTQKMEAAHEQYNDVLTYFLWQLHYESASGILGEHIRAYLDKLLRNTPKNVDPDLVRALMVYWQSWTDEEENRVISEWIMLLDDPSLLVAAAAADRFGDNVEWVDCITMSDAIALITEKELHRPGLAGAFYGPSHFHRGDFFPDDENCDKLMEWMMDLLERRKGRPEWGPGLDATLQNDISFYLHELCAFSPDAVRRMMAGGFYGLAMMTATEESQKVDGMQDVLKELAQNPDPDVCRNAKRHLQEYYDNKV